MDYALQFRPNPAVRQKSRASHGLQQTSHTLASLCKTPELGKYSSLNKNFYPRWVARCSRSKFIDTKNDQMTSLQYTQGVVGRRRVPTGSPFLEPGSQGWLALWQTWKTKNEDRPAPELSATRSLALAHWPRLEVSDCCARTMVPTRASIGWTVEGAAA